MIKRIFQIFIILITISSCITAQPDKEIQMASLSSENMSIEDHLMMKNRWQNLNIATYKMEVSYNSFSFRKGIWVLTITKGVLTGWETKNRINVDTDRNFAITLMQKNLFKLAEKAYIPDDNSSGYKTSVIYDEKGYIREINFIRNTANSKQPSTDKGFRIKIISMDY